MIVILIKQLYRTEQQQNDESYNHQLVCREKTDLIFVYDNKIKEYENIIKQLRQDIMKYHSNESTTELHIITEPTKANIELNNELTMSRSLLANYSHFFNQATKKDKEKSVEIKRLKNKIENMKKGRKIQKNIETIEAFGYLLTESNDDSNDNDSNDDEFIAKQEFQMKINTTITDHRDKHKRYKSAIIPKLDLSPIISKYKVLQQKDIKIKENKTNSLDDENEYIDKLKYQLDVSKITITKNKKTISKLKKIIYVLKNLYSTMKNLNQQSSSGGSTNDDKKSSKLMKNITINDSRVSKQY